MAISKSSNRTSDNKRSDLHLARKGNDWDFLKGVKAPGACECPRYTPLSRLCRYMRGLGRVIGRPNPYL